MLSIWASTKGNCIPTVRHRIILNLYKLPFKWTLDWSLTHKWLLLTHQIAHTPQMWTILFKKILTINLMLILISFKLKMVSKMYFCINSWSYCHQVVKIVSENDIFIKLCDSVIWKLKSLSHEALDENIRVKH